MKSRDRIAHHITLCPQWELTMTTNCISELLLLTSKLKGRFNNKNCLSIRRYSFCNIHQNPCLRSICVGWDESYVEGKFVFNLNFERQVMRL